jgi:hypothetical protein
MEVIARFVIVPLVSACRSVAWHHMGLVPTLLGSGETPLLTMIVLLLQMEGIAYVAAVAVDTTLSSADLLGLRRSLVVHAAGDLVVLVVTTTLSVYKPRGMTRYGWRKLHNQKGDTV